MIQRILTTFRMCLHTYSCIPLPFGDWDDDLSAVVPAFLPAVGLVTGLLWWLLAALAKWLLPDLICAVLVAVFPFIITGMVHLKGYWSVTASMLFGWRGLKDAPAGFISSATFALLVLLQFSACASVERIFLLALIPVLSRACCALHMMKQPNADSDEEPLFPASLLNIEKYIVIAALILMLVFSALTGLLSGCAVLGGYVLCSRILAKEAGNSQDACGFAIIVAELCGLIMMAIV